LWSSSLTCLVLAPSIRNCVPLAVIFPSTFDFKNWVASLARSCNSFSSTVSVAFGMLNYTKSLRGLRLEHIRSHLIPNIAHPRPISTLRYLGYVYKVSRKIVREVAVFLSCPSVYYSLRKNGEPLLRRETFETTPPFSEKIYCLALIMDEIW
jgi:hypothetical protein